MDIINHLNQTVTPAVLGATSDGEQEAAQQNVLEQFYAILTANLANPNNTVLLESGDANSRVLDHLWSEQQQYELHQQLENTHHVDKGMIAGLLGTAAPLAYHELKSLAGEMPLADFLQQNATSYRSYIPAWASALVPVTATVTTAPVNPIVAGPEPDPISPAAHRSEPVQRDEKSGFMKALLPILGLVILGALAWAALQYFQKDPEPVATPAVTAESPETPVVVKALPATLRLTTDGQGGLYACQADVGDAILQSNISAAVTSAFAGQVQRCTFMVDDSYESELGETDKFASLFALMKNVPFSSLLLQGDHLTLNAPDTGLLQRLVSDAQALLPDMTVQAAAPLDIDAEVNNSLEASRLALAGLPEDPDANDVARALSLQVINFAVDSDSIPKVNLPLLDRAVEIMKDVPDMSLLIVGHTDASADPAYNLELSQQRADAVKQYMVSKGVDASKLYTQGMGETQPIADNQTELGKFRNRRISFTVYDEAVVAAMNERLSQSNTVIIQQPEQGIEQMSETVVIEQQPEQGVVEMPSNPAEQAPVQTNPLTEPTQQPVGQPMSEAEVDALANQVIVAEPANGAVDPNASQAPVSSN